MTQPSHDDRDWEAVATLDDYELVDGTGENYGWPTLVRREPDEPEVAGDPVT